LAVTRSRAVFGDDAGVFRPERWLAATTEPERLRRMNAAVDLDFGHGRYQCLGKSIAMMELNKIYFEVGSTSLAALPYIHGVTRT
jgi:cytochrome P450